jgi:acyl-coenzyme A thioesterase 13
VYSSLLILEGKAIITRTAIHHQKQSGLQVVHSAKAPPSSGSSPSSSFPTSSHQHLITDQLDSTQTPPPPSTMTSKGIQSYNAPDLSLPIETRIRNLHTELTTTPGYVGYDTLGLRQCVFLSASAATQSSTWELTVTPELCNKGGNLHGGAAATILDSLTSTALLTIAKPGFLDAGHVSRNLNTTYLRPLPVGSKVRVECEVVAAGKNTAMVKGVIRTVDGKVAVFCAHDKAVFKKTKL